ncbi:MAG: LysR family transcriptional regulator [Phaeovulum sp.]|uniref:LysR family transcriptional regulator n=1 Tax=Phaeovulum sp. TaxID=2934796 RepID=UPI0027319F6C|nr:LysR family transcriptional regulator [Phaeovulum sp.]MDP2061507.1 LysR family transcriptional regulator [Phaeovulum sp.]
MNSSTPDWALLRSLLAVADAGSLSAAARALGTSQPTLGRHIRALEAGLGQPLFTRAADGLRPTEAARALVPHARAMREAAERLALTAAAQGAGLGGVVRITASRIVSHHLIPPILARLRHAHPEIEIELTATDTTENLMFGEADIAVRMYRPTEPEVAARHVADLPMGLFAARSYLDRAGRPENMDALLRLDWVGFDRSDMILRLMAGLGVNVGRNFFATRCDDQLVYWNLVRAGCGVGGMQTGIGDADPALERIADFIALPPMPVWLTVAERLRANPRVRLVLEALAEGFRAPLDPARASR